MHELIGTLIAAGLFYLFSGVYFYLVDWAFRDTKGRPFKRYLIYWPVYFVDDMVDLYTGFKNLFKRK